MRLTFLSCIFFMATLVPWQLLGKVSTLLGQSHLVVASLHVHLSGHRVEGVSGEVQETGDSGEVQTDLWTGDGGEVQTGLWTGDRRQWGGRERSVDSIQQTVSRLTGVWT